MYRPIIIAIATLALAACNETRPAPADVVEQAQKLIDQEFELRGPRKFGDAWLQDAVGDSDICGTFEPGPIGGQHVDERRYFYSRGDTQVMIDPIPETMLTQSEAMMAVIESNEELFNSIWADVCEPYRPAWYRPSAK